jgi:hypothetical protein
MAKRRKRRVETPLPPPLPAETRTVGQLVAETMRLYGDRFWPAILLGLPLAAVDQLTLDTTRQRIVGALWIGAPFLTAAYAGASLLAARSRVTARAWLTALVAGVIVFLPAAVLFSWFALLAVAWLAFAGLVVPVAMIEQRGFRASFRRANELARADYVHAVGSLAALAVVFFLARFFLVFLLESQGDNTIRTAVFLADLAIGPLLFLGAAVLYFDQAARVKSGSRPTRRTHADLRDAEHADPARRPDAEVKP